MDEIKLPLPRDEWKIGKKQRSREISKMNNVCAESLEHEKVSQQKSEEAYLAEEQYVQNMEPREIIALSGILSSLDMTRVLDREWLKKKIKMKRQRPIQRGL